MLTAILTIGPGYAAGAQVDVGGASSLAQLSKLFTKLDGGDEENCEGCGSK